MTHVVQQYESDGVSLIVEANDEEDLQNQLSRKDVEPEEVDEAVFQKFKKVRRPQTLGRLDCSNRPTPNGIVSRNSAPTSVNRSASKCVIFANIISATSVLNFFIPLGSNSGNSSRSATSVLNHDQESNEQGPGSPVPTTPGTSTSLHYFGEPTPNFEGSLANSETSAGTTRNWE